MNEKEKQERMKRKEQNNKIRKVVISDFFTDFTRYFRPWLHELTKQYKEKGSFPVMACWLLPSYYQDDLDKEIAAFASMLIKDDEKVLERVEAFRHLMGESPFMWFSTRAFVPLSIGNVQFRRTGGVLNRRIAEYFNTIYDNWANRQSAVNIIMKQTFSDTIYIDKAYMLRLVLGTSDGIGIGLWIIHYHRLKCPLTEDVKALLNTFFPDYVKLQDVNSAIRLFGFEKDCDLFYAALAYKELQKRNPKGCSRLATIYQRRYRVGNVFTSKRWLTGKVDGILPEIDLND
jgi:hypothetical protein